MIQNLYINLTQVFTPQESRQIVSMADIDPDLRLLIGLLLDRWEAYDKRIDDIKNDFSSVLRKYQ